MKKIIIVLIICVSFAFANLSFAGRVDTSEYPPQEDVEQDPPPVEDTTPPAENITPPPSGDITQPSLDDIAQNPPPDVVEHEHTPPVVEEPVKVAFCDTEMTEWEKEQLYKELYNSVIEGRIASGYSLTESSSAAKETGDASLISTFDPEDPVIALGLEALTQARDLVNLFISKKQCFWKVFR